MNQERRAGGRQDVLVISSDDLWCRFVENTLRRTDHVLDVHSLAEAEEFLSEQTFDIVFFSNRLVPRNMNELEAFLAWCSDSKVVVFFDPKDPEMHLSRKHLSQYGVEVVEKPTEGKALRREIKHALLSGEVESS